MEQSNGREHDVHAMPPQAICDLYKKYQKAENASIDADNDIVDFRRGLTSEQQKSIVPVDTISSQVIVEAEKAFRRTNGLNEVVGDATIPNSCTIYEHKEFPGTYTLSVQHRIQED
jgi:alkylated DNA repair protein alkB family protein 1